MAKAKLPIATARKRKTKILLVDDHPATRSGLAAIIAQQEDMAVCGEAEDAHKALEAIPLTKPNIVVVDITLNGANGIELLTHIKARHPKLLCLVYSMHDEAVYAQRALRAGAAGYLMKRSPIDQFIVALRKMLMGEVYLSERLGNRMLNTLVSGRASLSGSPIEELSDRELEVFNLIGEGYSTRTIAEKLQLSKSIIRAHITHTKEKLDLRGDEEFRRHAIQWVQSTYVAG